MDDELLDQPISSIKFDQLGFNEIAQTLADAITAQPNLSSLTLGLDGPWGSGKTSILSLLQDSLRESKDNQNGIGLIVVPFSPWLISNRAALISAFFSQIGIAIEKAEKRIPKDGYFRKKDTAKKLQRAREKLNKFSGFLSIASTAASVLDPTLISSATAGGAKAVAQLTDSSNKRGPTLETLKEELSENLKEIAQKDSSFRILVLIDDLDRLDPDDALEILRLVKAVGDFPAITYLLAYDKQAISTAIQHSIKVEKGDVYLEKIIQFSFKVPPLEPFQLRRWLSRELEKMYPGEIKFGSERANAVIDAWGGRLLKTPRDVKRILFAVRAVWARLKGKADLLDLVWLQLIAQKGSSSDANMYSWVESYLQSLDAISIGGRVSGIKDAQKELVEILTKLGWKTYTGGDETYSFDYHFLDQILAGVTASYLGEQSLEEKEWTYEYNQEEFQKFRDGCRLSSPWHWRLYFALDTPSHAITDDEWNALEIAAEKSEKELGSAIQNVLEFRGASRKDASDQIVERALHKLKSNNLKHKDRWVMAIVNQAEAMGEYSKSDNFFGLRKLFGYKIKVLVKEVVTSLTAQQRELVLSSIFEKKNNISIAAELFREQYLISTKKESGERHELYLTEDEITKIAEKQLQFYQSVTPDELIKLSSPYDVLFAWLDVSGSKEGPKALLEKAMNTDENMIKTLNGLKHVYSSAQNGIPHIPETYLDKFIDPEPIKTRLRKISESKTDLAPQASELLKLWWSDKHQYLRSSS